MVYRTMRGKEIDLDKIMLQNETMPAIGNMKVNARGDELGPGGKIIKRKDDVMAEYYDDNPPVSTPPVEVKNTAPIEDKPATQPKQSKTTSASE